MSIPSLKKTKIEINKQGNKECYTSRDLVRKSMIDLNHFNIFNKLSSKIKNPNKFVNKPNNNKIDSKRIISQISTGECTMNSSKLLTKIDPYLYKNSRKSLNKGIIRKKGTKRINRVKLSKIKLSEDTQFIHELLFKYIKGEIKNINKKSKNNVNDNTNDKDKDKDKSNEKIKFGILRNYIVNNQINFNQDFELFYLNNPNNENDDMIQIKKIDDLFSRYIIIIYYLLKVNFEEAKTLFLLMIKENEKYIDLFEYKIYKTFSKSERRINILKTIPRTAVILIKIFSSIIKYSIIFNKTRIKNIFLFRYLSLHSLIYRIFRQKCEIRGFTTETKNNIKFWFTSGLHFASYFCLYNYSPLKIPIALSELILKVYKNADESILNSNEKAMLINTSFNNSLLIYSNGQNDQALKSLEETRQRIISYNEERHVNNFNNLYNNGNNINNTSFHSKCSNIDTPTNQNSLRRSLFSKYRKKAHNQKENSLNSSNSFMGPLEIIENIDRIMTNPNRKNNNIIKMDNINSLFFVELQKNMKNSEKTLNLNNLENYQKFSSEYEVYSNRGKNNIEFSGGRNSSVNMKPLLDLKNYDVPKYMKNPLLIKIELLMCEIQIDKKNFFEAYDHIKTSIIIMFIMKSIGEIKLYENFKKEIRKMLTYLNQIEELNDLKIKKKQKAILIKKVKNKSNKAIIKFNDNSNVDNNNSNNSFIHNYTNNTLDFSRYSKKNNSMQNSQSFDYENCVEYQKGFLAEEIEKFFMFLNSLSLYQLKILNDFQPKTNNKNDLPILFHSQFKDSLSTSQRISLENLQTMTLSRYMILEDPDKPIFPTNLKFRALKTNLKKQNNILNNINNFSFNNNTHLSKTSNDDEDENENENENEIEDIATNTKEHEIFQKIIISKNNNIDLRKFLFANYDFVIKILKDLSEKEIENIIENPKIIEGPIKMYLKKKKNGKKGFSMSMNKQCFKINDYNYLFRNSSLSKDVKNKLANRKRLKSSFYSIDDFSFGSKNMNPPESYRRLSYTVSKFQ